MEINYIKDNIINAKGYIAHCISSDIVMGAGVAFDLALEFPYMRNNLRQYRVDVNGEYLISPFPMVIKTKRIFNLISKKYYFNESTYPYLTECLRQLKEMCVMLNITTLNIPKIGSKRDGLSWKRVSNIIKKTFGDIDNFKINIYVID